MNFLANFLPLNGRTSGEISDKLDVLFTPAGYVFSIWGLIYFLLAIWVFRQFLSKHQNSPANKASFPSFGYIIGQLYKHKKSGAYSFRPISVFRLNRLDECCSHRRHFLLPYLYRMGRFWDFQCSLDDPFADCSNNPGLCLCW